MMAYGKMCVICKRYTLVKIHTCRECLKNRINGLENRKYCNRCKTVKITSDFNKQSSRNDGLGDYCRECKREKDNQYNRETGNQRFGGSQLNIIQRSAKTRGYECYFTKEKLKEWWFSTIDTCYYCGIEIDEYNKLRDYISNYEGANRYILKFKALTIFSAGKSKWMTIDRKDNEVGYTVENIVKSCWFCNFVKADFVFDEDMKVIAPKIIGRLSREIESTI